MLLTDVDGQIRREFEQSIRVIVLFDGDVDDAASTNPSLPLAVTCESKLKRLHQLQRTADSMQQR